MRMTKEDAVLRESSYKRYGMKKHRTFSFPKSEEHDLMNQWSSDESKFLFFCWFLDLRCVICFGDNYYGAKATINVWEPKIHQQHEFTFLQIWLLSDLFRKYLNSIEAGWQVNRIYMVTIIQGSSLTGL
uniref:Neprosin PEP catalytic domain-containing protein n=1 Tax=Brassica oleracea TaxID=3712 RepID=A0A3P6EG01_BRAOL|nr:unnamed protein product [Brassica oleracea]